MSSKPANTAQTTQPKSRGKSTVLLAIVGILAVALIGGWLTISAISGKDPATAVKTAENGLAESALARQLEDESVTQVKIDGELALTAPLTVKGTKTLTGDGTITVADGVTLPDGLIRLSEGAELTVESGFVNCASAANGFYVPENAKLSLSGGEVTNAADWNIYNMGETEISGGTVYYAAGNNIYNAGQLAMSGGTVSDSGKNNIYLASGAALDMTGGTLSAGGTNNICGETLSVINISGEKTKINSAMVNGIDSDGEVNISYVNMSKNLSAHVRIGKNGSLTLSDGYFIGSSGYGIRNNGTMVMTGGEISSNALSGIENRGEMKITGGVITFNKERAITNKIGGTAQITGRHVELSGSSYGVYNEENAEIRLDDVELKNNSTSNIRNFGSVYVSKADLLDCGSNSVSNYRNGYIYLEDVNIERTVTNHGIYNDRGEVAFKNLKVKDVSSRAIQNKGGIVSGSNLSADNCGGAVIGNNLPNDSSQGKMTINGFTTRNPQSNNIYCENGSISVSNGYLAVASKNSVRVTAGSISLSNVTIAGTTKPGENASSTVYTSGGCSAYLSNVTINNSASPALNNRGGNVTMSNVTIDNAQATAIYNRPDSASGVVGNITGERVTVKNSVTSNVNNEAEGTTISLKDSRLEATPKSNVVVTKGTVELVNTAVLGTTGDDQKPNFFISKGATGIIGGSTVISDAFGKGVNNEGTFYMNGGSIRNNRANAGAGLTNSGVAYLSGGNISGNKSLTASGGGVINNTGAKLYIDGASISGNTAATMGGGMALNDGSLCVMTAGSVSGNKAGATGGGGVNVAGGAKLQFLGGSFSGNTIPANGVGSAIRASSATSELYMGGGASVAADNAIYVHAKTYIRLTAKLTAGPINLELGGYSYRQTVLREEPAGVGALPGGKDKFLLPESKRGEWYIDNDGRLGNSTIVPSDESVARVVATGVEYTSLQDAVDAIADGGTATIEIVADIAQPNLVTIGGGKNITITDDGTARTISRQGSYTDGRLIVVSGGSSLTLKSTGNDSDPKLIFNGGVPAANGQFIAVGSDAKDSANNRMTIGAGVALRNNVSTSTFGGALAIYAGSVQMNGGLIENNLSGSGAGAVNVGNAGTSFVMNGGTIKGNEAAAGANAGAVNVAAGANFTMNGGTITGNIAHGYGGGVSVSGSFTMKGGFITDNTNDVYRGGGVNVAGGGSFTMSGGEISGNSTKTTGGGVSLQSGVSMVMTGGVITGNSASSGGDGIELHFNNNTLTLGGQPEIQDIYFFAASGSAIQLNSGFKSSSPIPVTVAQAAPGFRVLAAGNYSAEQLGYFKVDSSLYALGADGTLNINEAAKKVARLDGNETFATLQLAIDAISAGGSGTVELLDDISLESPVQIKNKTVTLTTDGTARSIKRGSSTGRLIQITEGASLTMQGKNSGTLTIDGEKKTISGAAQIFQVGVENNSKGTLVINEGVIIENAINASGAGVAISILNGDVTMNGGEIRNNKNTAAAGGAINVGNANARFTMTGGKIIGNTAGTNAGGVNMATSATFIMSGGEISGNTAGTGYGGGVNVGDKATLTVTGGTISGNTAGNESRGIHLLKNTSALTLGGTPVIDYIYFAVASSNGITLNAGFTSASPIGIGVASPANGYKILAAGNYSAEQLACFELDPALSAYTLGEDGKLRTKEAATGVARVVGKQEYATLQEALDEVENGGTIELLDDIELSGEYKITGGKKITLTTDGNPRSIKRASGTGRMLWIQDGTELILQGKGSGTLTIDGQGDNYTVSNGQLIAVGVDKGTAGTLVINEGAILTGAKITGTGAAIGIYNGTATMNGGEISGNTNTSGAGGAINVAAGTTFNMYGGSIHDNKTISETGNGGGAINLGGVMNMSGGNITGNSSKTKGGVVYLSSSGSKLSISGSAEISGNTATGDGGAVYLNHASGSVNISGGKISGNSAAAGGGVYIAKGNVTIIGGTIEKNTATGNGGGVYLNNASSSFTLSDSGKISGNKGTQGGGVYINAGTMNMNGGSVEGNTANTYGGGVLATTKDGKFNMTGGSITGNTATKNMGGGVQIGSAGSMTMSGGSITGNTAADGGAGVNVGKTTAKLTMSGGSITGNGVKNIFIQAVTDGEKLVLSGSVTIDKIVVEVDVSKATNSFITVKNGFATSTPISVELSPATEGYKLIDFVGVDATAALDYFNLTNKGYTIDGGGNIVSSTANASLEDGEPVMKAPSPEEEPAPETADSETEPEDAATAETDVTDAELPKSGDGDADEPETDETPDGDKAADSGAQQPLSEEERTEEI